MMPPERISLQATGDRDAILMRVREALKVPTNAKLRDSGGKLTDGGIAARDIAAVLPPGGSTPIERMEIFAARCAGLKAELHVTPDLDGAIAVCRRLADEETWQRVAHHNHPLVAPLARSLGLEMLATDNGYIAADLESCSVGITACDALIAQTGSVLLTSVSAGGRALSVLPPHHVVIATADQLLPDLPSAYQLIAERFGRDWPSFVTIITGASRTGDIERILVLGAHGPKRLSIIVIEQ